MNVLKRMPIQIPSLEVERMRTGVLDLAVPWVRSPGNGRMTGGYDGTCRRLGTVWPEGGDQDELCFVLLDFV